MFGMMRRYDADCSNDASHADQTTKRSRFSEEQIIGILRQHEADVSVAGLPQAWRQRRQHARDAETLRCSIARVRSGEEETFTSDEVDAFLAAKTPLAFFRKKRGMSQDDLARRAGITQGYLSEIEIGREGGDVRTLRKLADALAVSLDSLVPDEPSEKDTPPPRAKKRKA